MVNRLVNVVLRAAELAEAEGRMARRAVAELVLAGMVLLLGGALGILACGAIGAALVLSLWPVMPPPVALGITGGALALGAWLTASTGRRMARPDR